MAAGAARGDAEAFDGCLVFDEAHRARNLAKGTKTAQASLKEADMAALEAELNAAYDEAVDRRKPRHWPAIALNPIDT